MFRSMLSCSRSRSRRPHETMEKHEFVFIRNMEKKKTRAIDDEKQCHKNDRKQLFGSRQSAPHRTNKSNVPGIHTLCNWSVFARCQYLLLRFISAITVCIRIMCRVPYAICIDNSFLLDENDMTRNIHWFRISICFSFLHLFIISSSSSLCSELIAALFDARARAVCAACWKNISLSRIHFIYKFVSFRDRPNRPFEWSRRVNEVHLHIQKYLNAWAGVKGKRDLHGVHDAIFQSVVFAWIVHTLEIPLWADLVTARFCPMMNVQCK